MAGILAMKKLLADYSFATVLDIGCGEGRSKNILENSGKLVTAIDIKPKIRGIIVADYMNWFPDKQYDCIWCCHVLEHQLNVNLFLKKIHSELKEGGVFAVSVPPMKHQIVGGHVSLWNAGLLLYNLVMAGFDCTKPAIKTYDYNVSVVVKKKTIKLPGDLNYDVGDLEKLSMFFPPFVKQNFNGNILEYNW